MNKHSFLTCLSFITLALLLSFSSFAEERNQNAPEQSEFDLENLSYTFEQTLLDLSNAYINSSPVHKADGIEVGHLNIENENKESISELAREIADNKHGSYDSMLISHENKLVFESYYKKGRINLPHFQASVTKSYVSIAIGRAIQLGCLTIDDLDKPVVSFLKNIDLEKLADGAENITLHHAMSMRSGIRVSADRLKIIMENSANAKGSDVVQEFLQHSEAISSASQSFKYQDSDARITMRVLDSVVPGSAKDFVKNEVLAKLGITVYGWKDDVNGLPIPESSSSMTSRNMLKLGMLVINKGQWNGEQLISAHFLAKATSNITKPTEDWIPDSFNYGYFLYRTEMKVGDERYAVNLAWGSGGQYILMLEELGLVIVITGHDREDTILTQVSRVILPALIQPRHTETHELRP